MFSEDLKNYYSRRQYNCRGFGSAVAEFAAQNNYKNDLLIHGIPDRFIEHGKPEELHFDLKIDAAGIAEVAEEFFIKQKVYV